MSVVRADLAHFFFQIRVRTQVTLCWAMRFPGQGSGFRAGIRTDSSRESLKGRPPDHLLTQFLQSNLGPQTTSAHNFCAAFAIVLFYFLAYLGERATWGSGQLQFTKNNNHTTKPYEFIGFGDIDGPKPYEFIGFGDIDGPKPYEFIGFGDYKYTRDPDAGTQISPGSGHPGSGHSVCTRAPGTAGTWAPIGSQ
jgi:hypothetical protein